MSTAESEGGTALRHARWGRCRGGTSPPRPPAFSRLCRPTRSYAHQRARSSGNKGIMPCLESMNFVPLQIVNDRGGNMRGIVLGLLLFSLPALAQDVWLNYAFAHRPMPKWQNGFLLAYQTHNEPSAIFVFDRSGQMVLN